MARSQIKVNTNPVAGNYTYGNERIVEFSSPNGGGLISFTMKDDGTLHIDIYRQDPTVTVNVDSSNNS